MDNLFLGPLLKIIFFDGEEAFEEWTETDSLYPHMYYYNRTLIYEYISKCLFIINDTVRSAILPLLIVQLWGEAFSREMGTNEYQGEGKILYYKYHTFWLCCIPIALTYDRPVIHTVLFSPPHLSSSLVLFTHININRQS